jgi:hypothetical protein
MELLQLCRRCCRLQARSPADVSSDLQLMNTFLLQLFHGFAAIASFVCYGVCSNDAIDVLWFCNVEIIFLLQLFCGFATISKYFF